MAEFPALPIWTDALLADTNHLSHAEFGLYMRVLILMWRTPSCQVTNDYDWIARKLNSDAIALRTLCDEFCTPSQDGKFLSQKRLLKQWVWCHEKREKASESSKYRWNNGKGSSERIANGMQSQSDGNASKSISKSITSKLTNFGFEGKKEGVAEADLFEAQPQSPEFQAWMTWAIDNKRGGLAKFLKTREIEGRPFKFDSQWPPGYTPPA